MMYHVGPAFEVHFQGRLRIIIGDVKSHYFGADSQYSFGFTSRNISEFTPQCSDLTTYFLQFIKICKHNYTLHLFLQPSVPIF